MREVMAANYLTCGSPNKLNFVAALAVNTTHTNNRPALACWTMTKTT